MIKSVRFTVDAELGPSVKVFRKKWPRSYNPWGDSEGRLIQVITKLVKDHKGIVLPTAFGWDYVPNVVRIVVKGGVADIDYAPPGVVVDIDDQD